MQELVKVKICGLSRHADIEAVNEAMPDYVGYVFAQSRRRISPKLALELRERLLSGIIPVGVFVDEKIEYIIDLIKHGVIDIVQLHGSEDESYIQRLKSKAGKPIIKAVAVQGIGDVQKWAHTCADYLLLDKKGGGTGTTFDWSLIGQCNLPYFLAGGLCPENITEALSKTAPFAVDVSSGVETKGLKDHAKIKDFVRRVKHEGCTE